MDDADDEVDAKDMPGDQAQGLHPEPVFMRFGHRWRPGQSGNPSGKPSAEKAASRTIGEACRAAHSPEEVQAALWSIFAGADPFAKRRRRNPDGLPEIGGANGIDWQHRMKAGEMWANYAYGKPLQGVVVDAQIQQSNVNVSVAVGPVDPRGLPPDVRAALRLVAQAALGRAPDAAAVSTRPAADRAPQLAPGPDLAAPGEGDPAAVSLDDVGLYDVDGLLISGAVSAGTQRASLEVSPRGGLGLGVEQAVDVSAHGQTIVADRPAVKGIVLNFGDSTNLVDAALDAGILTVRFRGGDGSVARVYRYRNVTPEMMARWRAAPSAGAWFAREIRARHQQYPVVPDPIREPGIVL